MSYWKKYNEKLSEVTELMTSYNKTHQFNFVESTFYPHIRDILGLTISLLVCKKNNRQLKILDYGSNLTVWANFQNKIETRFLKVSIYDPFIEIETYYSILPYKEIFISPNLFDLRKKKYDLVIFGSVAQYDSRFLSSWNKERNFNTNYILFTHTPLSLSSSFTSKQFSDYKGLQTIHSFRDILTKLKNNSYDLIFKSTLSNQNASVEQKFLSNTIYANLLFKKFI